MSVVVLTKLTASENAKADCLAVLEQLRKQVEEGETTGLFILANNVREEWIDIWAGDSPLTTTVVGRLEVVKQDLIERYRATCT